MSMKWGIVTYRPHGGFLHLDESTMEPTKPWIAQPRHPRTPKDEATQIIEQLKKQHGARRRKSQSDKAPVQRKKRAAAKPGAEEAGEDSEDEDKRSSGESEIDEIDKCKGGIVDADAKDKGYAGDAEPPKSKAAAKARNLTMTTMLARHVCVAALITGWCVGRDAEGHST